MNDTSADVEISDIWATDEVLLPDTVFNQLATALTFDYDPMQFVNEMNIESTDVGYSTFEASVTYTSIIFPLNTVSEISSVLLLQLKANAEVRINDT